MISSAHRFIFLHAPKTGGNSVQSVLFPFSDDCKVISANQDGNDRFGVQGPITRTKHMDLQGYAEILGDRLSCFRVILTVRDPLDRSLSAYFGPIRMLAGARVDTFDVGEFSELVAGMRPLVSFLTVGTTIRKPDHLLRFNHLREDFCRLMMQLNLPHLDLPMLNISTDKQGLRDQLKHDAKVRDIVWRRFSDDYDHFREVLG